MLLISTLLLWACISTFPIICDIHTTFGHNVQPRHCSRMCSESLGIHTMSFRSFPTSHDPYQHFLMFLCYFWSLLAYIGLISTSMDYLCIPHTIVYLSDVFPTLSDLLQSLFIFALINVPMFWLFLIVDRFHWLWCYYMFGLQSLQTIGHIWTSNTILTHLMLLLLILHLPLPF